MTLHPGLTSAWSRWSSGLALRRCDSGRWRFGGGHRTCWRRGTGGGCRRRAGRWTWRRRQQSAEFFVEVFSPRYSHIYAAALNRPCLLVETHSLKDPKTRAWANYDIMVSSIDIVTEDPQMLRTAVRAADAKYAAMAGDRNAPPVYLAGKTSAALPSARLPLAQVRNSFKSEITGTMVAQFTAEKDDIATVTHDSIDTTAEAQEPLGFIVPAEWKEIADELALHGVRDGAHHTSRSSRSSIPGASPT